FTGQTLRTDESQRGGEGPRTAQLRARAVYGPGPVCSGSGSPPTRVPGAWPPGDPGTWPPGDPGTCPPGDPGTCPPGDPGTCPPGDPGTCPPGDPGTCCFAAFGLRRISTSASATSRITASHARSLTRSKWVGHSNELK